MKIILVSATEMEIAPFIQKHPEIEVLITGVGMVATAFALGKFLQKHTCDLVINAGIAGAFDQNTALGTVFSVVEDCFSELGVEDADTFISMEDLGFAKVNFKAHLPPKWNEIAQLLPLATGITVNMVHGQKESIEKLRKSYKVTLESMETAAVLYACEQENIPCLALRSISNHVEVRNKLNWNIPLAIQQLNDKLEAMMQILNQKN